MILLNIENAIKELETTLYIAGKEILKIYNSNSIIQAAYKSDNSPVTLADKLANQIILDCLKKINPKINVVSEESTNTNYKNLTNIFWLVDPLDGTKEFINKNGEFTINVALIQNHKVVAGVVYAPALNKMYTSYNNHAFCNNKKLTIEPTTNKKDLKVAISRSHSNDANIKHFLQTNKIEVGELIKLGSSLKICQIASGEVDLYPRLGTTMEWDIAAAHAILKASGGYLCTFDKKELEYGKKDYKNPYFVASNTNTLSFL